MLDILKPSLVVGGQADWNASNSLPIDFVPEGMSDEPLENPVARHWKAMTSGGSTGRPKVILDHQPAVTDPAGVPPLAQPAGASLLNPGPLYHNAPFIVSHMALFYGGRVTGMTKFDAEETLRLIEASRVQWVNFVPTMMHRIWALPEDGAQPLRPLQPADRVPHGRPDAALAEGEVDRVARAGAHLRTLWRHRGAGPHRHHGRRMARAQGLGRQDRRRLPVAHHRRGRQ